MDTNKEKIIASMKPLFVRAEKEMLWFYCHYQRLWFSPLELQKAQSEGHFCWGPDNWVLRNPNEHLRELEHLVEGAKRNLENFLKRLQES